ncbi:flavodoxin [Eubacterium callanderi]|uniref:Flavodoxin n=1 Tax=Eubacterium limosum TaxID=1736 RepID=A0A6N3G3M3_EUBLI|nr:flavodoxin [Eubacterium callanderi]MBO1701515.1 flavodoxin [Eubacterium callanderi]
MNTLIAYFSYTGHTKGVAQQLQNLTGGTLFEIQPQEAYSSDYDITERQGRKETHDGYRPLLTEQVSNLDSYDTILLGTPNWFNTVTPPVATFLSENDFSGKKIALFCSNGGGGLGHTVSDIRFICKGADVLDSLSIYEDGGADVKAKLMAWLNKNGLNQ